MLNFKMTLKHIDNHFVVMDIGFSPAWFKLSVCITCYRHKGTNTMLIEPLAPIEPLKWSILTVFGSFWSLLMSNPILMNAISF